MQGPAPILVVDDDEDCRAAVREVLEEDGFTVVEAADGRVALDYLVSHDAPSLIILDAVMPAISGWQLLTILQNYYRLSQIPVLMLSGCDVPANVDNQLVSRFMPKPYDANDLVKAVHRYQIVRPSSAHS